MAPMPGVDFADMYSPHIASKEMAIAGKNAPGGNVPRLFSSLIIALSYLLDAQEDPRLYHGWRVAAVSTAMAKQMLPKQVTDVFFAALLHDVGGMGQFSHMVHYPFRHRQDASPEIIAHPHRGAEIVRAIPGLELAAEFVADHHEHQDGSGYPARKSGDDIPLGAQLIRIADSADIAKTLRPETSPERAIELSEQLADVEVSQEVADAFRSVISKKNFYRELTDETKLLPLIHKLESKLTLPAFRAHSDVTGTVLTVFANVVDAKHGFTSGHSERVETHSLELAKTMNLPHDEITKVRFAALLHDVGKVAVPRSIIDKIGPLTNTELFQIKHYPVLTMAIVGNIAYLSELSWIAGHHHEHWDGTGYPDGLKSEEIPMLSRILAVADAMDAITSARSYRPARSVPEALEILREASGSQFDPRVVDAAHAVWGSGY